MLTFSQTSTLLLFNETQLKSLSRMLSGSFTLIATNPLYELDLVLIQLHYCQRTSTVDLLVCKDSRVIHVRLQCGPFSISHLLEQCIVYRLMLHSVNIVTLEHVS